MPDWIFNIPPVLEFLVLFAAALAALLSINKFLVRPVRKYIKKLGASADTLLGYEEIIDHTTGKVYKPATPPLANRVESLEELQVTTTEALKQIAEALDRMNTMDERIMTLAERIESHEEWSHQKWSEHETFTNRWIEEHNTLHVMVDDKSVRPH